MKEAKLFFAIIAILIVTGVGYSVCEGPQQCETSLKVTYIDGYSEVLTFLLPCETTFHVKTYNGSYSLYYNEVHPLRSGVLRYKVLLKVPVVEAD